MSSREEIKEMLIKFYIEVVRQPYLDSSSIKIPPASGWDKLDVDTLQDLGKTDAAIGLLQHLPYLESSREYEKLLVWSDTTPIAYTGRPSAMMEEVNPLPSHCIYLTEGVDGGGYSLILNAEEGTITLYTVTGDDIPHENQANYDALPRSEQWRAHRTLPAAQLLNTWASSYARLVNMLVPNVAKGPTTGTFRTRGLTREQSEQMAHESGPLEQWQPDIAQAVRHIEDEQMRQHQMTREQHVADLYNCYLRHGWPDSFDKSTCRAAVVELENGAAARERDFLDANNPDAALFDD